MRFPSLLAVVILIASSVLGFGQEPAPNWVKMTDNAGWRPRDSQGEVVFQDQLWIFGGWFDSFHAAVLNDKMYVFGGGNYVPKYHAVNDVWSSEDGLTWTKVTDAASWSPRLWFSSAVYRDRIWVIGGWSNNPSNNWGDVWSSKNGKDWKQLKSDVIWKERHEHSVYVFQDKLWIAGGHAQPLSSEVWSLEIPKDWFKDK